VRGIDSQEQSALQGALSALGITSGGARPKIKSKDLIGMKKNQKGGQRVEHAPTDPRAHSYGTTTFANGYLVDKMDQCEGTHYESDQADLNSGVSTYKVANTNTAGHALSLKKCLVSKVYDDAPAATRPSTEYKAESSIGFAPLPYTSGYCTSSQGNRIPCPTGYPSDQTSKLSLAPAAQITYYNPDGTLPQGGAATLRKRSRSPSPKNKRSSPSRMARKSSRRSTRRASTRKGSRKDRRRATRRHRK
jgi:hypothetical protein